MLTKTLCIKLLVMKYFKKNTSILLLLVSNFIFLFSCNQNEKVNREKITIPQHWLGTWIVKDVFDTISNFDSCKTNLPLQLNISKYGATEISITKNNDSILFCNEDLEIFYSRIIFSKNDTLKTADGFVLFYDDSLQLLSLKLTVNKPHYNYVKTSTEISTKNLQSFRIFRKKFNSEFHKYSYLIKDSSNFKEQKRYASFFSDGKIKGYLQYENYYIPLNGDLNNIEDAQPIILKSSTSEKTFGMRYYCDSIELYELLNLSLQYEKPYFKCSRKIATLEKQKWY